METTEFTSKQPYTEEFLERYDEGVKHAQAAIRAQDEEWAKELARYEAPTPPYRMIGLPALTQPA